MKRFESHWAKLVLSGTALILIYKLLNNYRDIAEFFGNLFDILFPIILGGVIAFFLSKPAEKIERLIGKIKFNFIKKKALLISVISLYVLVFLVLFLAIKFVAPRIYKNIEEFTQNIPGYYNVIKTFLSENEFFSKFNSLELLSQKFASMFNMTQINKYLGIISGIANGFLTFFVAVILSVYMIIEKKNIFSFSKSLTERIIPEKPRKVIYAYGRKSIDLFYSYFTGLALDALLVGAVASVFLSLLGVPYAFLLGLIVAFGNLVPFFGPIVSNIIIITITLLTTGPFKALWVAVFQIIFGQIDGNIIQPKIISNSTGISPLLVLVAVIVFGDLFGFVGMIVGVPVCAIIKELVEDYVEDGKINKI